MDTPPLVYRFIYRSPGRQALAPATLGYCGVRAVRAEFFGPVVASSATQRNDWLARARASGARLAHGALSPAQRVSQGITAWLALTQPELTALLGWSAAAGALHGAWLWHLLRRFTHKEMPQRIDGIIVLALTFMLWFCPPPLIVLAQRNIWLNG